MRVLGVDPSLTGTGWALIDDHDDFPVQVGIVKSKPPVTQLIGDRADRIARITEALPALTPSLVVIERPAFARTNGMAHDRSGLWWAIVDLYLARAALVVEVGIQQVKKYATGSGTADKGAVVEAVTRRYPEIETRGNDNICDAVVLAAMGARHLGRPLEESLPAANLSALEKVMWP